MIVLPLLPYRSLIVFFQRCFIGVRQQIEKVWIHICLCVFISIIVLKVEVWKRNMNKGRDKEGKENKFCNSIYVNLNFLTYWD